MRTFSFWTLPNILFKSIGPSRETRASSAEMLLVNFLSCGWEMLSCTPMYPATVSYIDGDNPLAVRSQNSIYSAFTERSSHIPEAPVSCYQTYPVSGPGFGQLCVCVFVHMSVCACTYVYIHAYTHAYTQKSFFLLTTGEMNLNHQAGKDISSSPSSFDSSLGIILASDSYFLPLWLHSCCC